MQNHVKLKTKVSGPFFLCNKALKLWKLLRSYLVYEPAADITTVPPCSTFLTEKKSTVVSWKSFPREPVHSCFYLIPRPHTHSGDAVLALVPFFIVQKQITRLDVEAGRCGGSYSHQQPRPKTFRDSSLSSTPGGVRAGLVDSSVKEREN